MGFAVVAPELACTSNDAFAAVRDAETSRFAELIEQALAGAVAGAAWLGGRADAFVTWGEGFGGTLAIAVAALAEGVPVRGVAALNPLGEALVTLAPRLTVPLLLGTCMMDEIAPPRVQAAIAHHVAGPVRRFVYPKFAHERVNDFEDELLIWLRAFVPRDS